MLDKLEAFDIITNFESYKQVWELVMKMGNPACSLKSSLFLNTEKYYDLLKWNKVYLHTLVLTIFDSESPNWYDLDEVFNEMFYGIRRLTIDFVWTKSIRQAAKYFKDEIYRQKTTNSNIFDRIEEYEIDLTWIQIENIQDLMYLLTVLQPKSKLWLKWKEINNIVLLGILLNIPIKTLDIIYTGFDMLRESGNIMYLNWENLLLHC